MKNKIRKAWKNYHIGTGFDPDEVSMFSNPCFDAGYRAGYAKSQKEFYLKIKTLMKKHGVDNELRKN